MPLSGQLATTQLGEVPGRSSHIAGLPGQPVSPLSGRSRRGMKGTEPRKAQNSSSRCPVPVQAPPNPQQGERCPWGPCRGHTPDRSVKPWQFAVVKSQPHQAAAGCGHELVCPEAEVGTCPCLPLTPSCRQRTECGFAPCSVCSSAGPGLPSGSAPVCETKGSRLEAGPCGGNIARRPAGWEEGTAGPASAQTSSLLARRGPEQTCGLQALGPAGAGLRLAPRESGI